MPAGFHVTINTSNKLAGRNYHNEKKHKTRCFPVTLRSNGSRITGWLLFKKGGTGGYRHNRSSRNHTFIIHFYKLGQKPFISLFSHFHVLDFIPEHEAGRESVIEILNKLAAQIKRTQDPATGVWYQNKTQYKENKEELK